MELKRGIKVGLNKEKRSHYFQGSNGINLIKNVNDTAVIPEDITDANLEMIRKAIVSGNLVIGNAEEAKPVVKYEQDDDLLLKKGVRKVVPALEEISKTYGKDDKSPVARLEKIMLMEKKDKNRSTIINKIEELLDGLAGVSSVIEEDNEEIKIKLV